MLKKALNTFLSYKKSLIIYKSKKMWRICPCSNMCEKDSLSIS